MKAEKIIMNFLGLETREDFREYNKGNIIDLDLNKQCDIAYIRCQFKRFLLKNKPKEMKLYTSFNNGYSIITENDILDFSNLQDRNKIINRINLALTEIKINNEKIFGLK